MLVKLCRRNTALQARFVQERDNQSGLQDFNEESNIPDQH